MALRGKSISEVRATGVTRLKMFIYGAAGSGKSFFCTQFNKPYYIDTEHGADKPKYQKNLEEKGAAYLAESDFNMILNEVNQLERVKHDYQTLVIDSITVVYAGLINEYKERMQKKTGREVNNNQLLYGYANTKIYYLFERLKALDMNVVITAYEKQEHIKDKDGNIEKILTSGEAPKKYAHVFDVVARFFTQGNSHKIEFVRSRLNEMPEGKVIENDYNLFAGIYSKELEWYEPKVVESKVDVEIVPPEHLEYAKDFVMELQSVGHSVDTGIGLNKFSSNELEEYKAKPFSYEKIMEYFKLSNLMDIGKNDLMRLIMTLEKYYPSIASKVKMGV